MSELIIKPFCLLFPLIQYRQEAVCFLNGPENSKYTINKTPTRVASFVLSFGTRHTARAYKTLVNKASAFLQQGS